MQFNYGYKSNSFAQFGTKHFRLLSCLYVLYTISAILVIVYVEELHNMLSSLAEVPNDLITIIVTVLIVLVILIATSLVWLAATGIMIALIIVRYKNQGKA